MEGEEDGDLEKEDSVHRQKATDGNGDPFGSERHLMMEIISFLSAKEDFALVARPRREGGVNLDD